MAKKLILKKGEATVSITINVMESDLAIEFKNAAMSGISNLDVPVNALQPFLTYRAIDAACISGLRFARRKVGVAGLCGELLAYSWSGAVESAEPFAIATAIAARYAFGNIGSESEDEVDGWCVDSIEDV